MLPNTTLNIKNCLHLFACLNKGDLLPHQTSTAHADVTGYASQPDRNIRVC